MLLCLSPLGRNSQAPVDTASLAGTGQSSSSFQLQGTRQEGWCVGQVTLGHRAVPLGKARRTTDSPGQQNAVESIKSSSNWVLAPLFSNWLALEHLSNTLSEPEFLLWWKGKRMPA